VLVHGHQTTTDPPVGPTQAPPSFHAQGKVLNPSPTKAAPPGLLCHRPEVFVAQFFTLVPLAASSKRYQTRALFTNSIICSPPHPQGLNGSRCDPAVTIPVITPRYSYEAAVHGSLRRVAIKTKGVLKLSTHPFFLEGYKVGYAESGRFARCDRLVSSPPRSVVPTTTHFAPPNHFQTSVSTCETPSALWHPTARRPLPRGGSPATAAPRRLLCGRGRAPAAMTPVNPQNHEDPRDRHFHNPRIPEPPKPSAKQMRSRGCSAGVDLDGTLLDSSGEITSRCRPLHKGPSPPLFLGSNRCEMALHL